MQMLIDLYQQRRLRQSVSAAESGDVDELERRVEMLTLASQALWEILRSHFGLNDDVVLQKMQEIDLRDGRLDGKAGAQLLACPHCQRTNRTGRKYCLYCGERLPTPPPAAG